MKKQYENKITIISAIIFHLALIIGYLSIQSIESGLCVIILGIWGIANALVMGFTCIIIGILGALVVTIQLWHSYLKKQKNAIMLTSTIINTMVVGIGVLSFVSVTADSSIKLLFYISIIGFLFHLIIVFCLEDVWTIKALNPYFPTVYNMEDSRIEVEKTAPMDIKN